jgi:hypothetical protein
MRTRHVGEVADQEFDDVVDLLLAQIVDQRTAQLVHRVAQRLLDQLIALYSHDQLKTGNSISRFVSLTWQKEKTGKTKKKMYAGV